MNLELLEAFHQNYPETNDGQLERIKRDENSREVASAPYVVNLRFNRLGNLIALGCNDGRIEIWDFITRHMAKSIMAHPYPICSLSWSRDSRYLVSCSTDNLLCIWNIVKVATCNRYANHGEDLIDPFDCVSIYRFPCPLLSVQVHPRNLNNILVCPMRHYPVVLKWKENQKSDNFEPPILVGQPPVDDDLATVDMNFVASYDLRGQYIYCANAKGQINIYDSIINVLVRSFRATSTASSGIKHIEFSRRGEAFLLNCSDKIIRVYDCSSALNETNPEPKHKLRDIVTQTQWRKCCFSGDGEYVCAGSMKQHSIYMWERSTGTLVKILQGQKGESLHDVVWHPLRPIIVSLSNSVTREQVTIWAQTQVQNWSAFAPDFKELDENVEYDERESEFDLENEDKSVDSVEDCTVENSFIDIETVVPVSALLSSDEENEPEDILYYIPISPIADNPDEIDAESYCDASNLSALGSRKRHKSDGCDDNVSSSKKPHTISGVDFAVNQSHPIVHVDLPGAHSNDVHPLSGLSRKVGFGMGGKLQCGSSSGSGFSSLSGDSPSSQNPTKKLISGNSSSNRTQRDRFKYKK